MNDRHEPDGTESDPRKGLDSIQLNARPPSVRGEDAKTTPVSSPAAAAPANALTPEEQMALFEEDLKENDWGHQPC
jgi:hypothetical protein